MPRTAIQWTTTIALTLVLLLIFIGGLVRATGAGLGCPDWPRCWGSWWPPASANEIRLENLNPKKIPQEYRDAPDPRVFFNHQKMWIEYLNRLWGVLAGLAVVAMVLTAIPYVWRQRSIFGYALLSLVLMLFQGWLGALVVRSGLKQSMISIHMAIALLILGVLIYTRFLAYGAPRAAAVCALSKRLCLRKLAILALVLTLVQVLGGTHVREVLDHVADTQTHLNRSQWISQVGLADHFHRLFSWPVLFAVVAIFWQTRRTTPPLQRRATLALCLVMTQISLGISLVYFGLPPASQFLHLGIAAALASVLFRVWLDAAADAKDSVSDNKAFPPSHPVS